MQSVSAIRAQLPSGSKLTLKNARLKFLPGPIGEEIPDEKLISPVLVM
jgi:hypothetical protein